MYSLLNHLNSFADELVISCKTTACFIGDVQLVMAQNLSNTGANFSDRALGSNPKALRKVTSCQKDGKVRIFGHVLTILDLN